MSECELASCVPRRTFASVQVWDPCSQTATASAAWFSNVLYHETIESNMDLQCFSMSLPLKDTAELRSKVPQAFQNLPNRFVVCQGDFPGD